MVVLFSVVIYVLIWKITLQLVFSWIDELCYIYVGGGSIGNDEEGFQHDLEQMPSFTKVCAAYKSVKSVFCPQNISECEEQNILNLELAPFCLGCKASTRQLSDISLNKKVMCPQVLMQLLYVLLFS